MGNNRPVKVKCWEAFMESKGCKYKRTKASHDHWDCPNCTRNIIHRGSKKDIPAFHIKSNLASMGVSVEEFYEWAEKNC